MHAQSTIGDKDMDFLGIECAWPDQARLGTSRLRPPAARRRWRNLLLIIALWLAKTGVWQLGQAAYI